MNKKPRNKSTGRNYKNEYAKYQGTEEQKKRRAKRNTARRKMVKAGKAKKGDGKDVHHKSGNPNNNALSNLSAVSKKKNRSYPRTKTARKKNRKD